MKRLMFCVLMLIGLLGFAAKAEGGLKVVATNFPCYDFARQVAGDRGEVTLLIHPGVEVHSYEPSPADILAIGGADLFVYVGGESDAWVESILSGFDAAGAPATLRMMEAVTPLEEEGEDDAHAHGEGPEYDEHIWTSPKNAMDMVAALSDALSGLDPDNAGAYAAAAESYIGQIEEIDAAFAGAVESGKRRELVFADRFPFLYFVREYGLDYVAAFPSCTAQTEPTPQTMLTLIRRVEQDGIPVVYTIEMSTQAVARAVAEETGAGIRTLYSLQTVTQAQFDAGETYVSLMSQNVEAVREGLN
ncbi:MAG: zinc ABC transporter substrate-binding protein [Clostridia bacterium]|nr:zinc ABC transporter substrate-binding protein [Clostridia bacterium]